MDTLALRAFDDNYIWLLRAGKHAAVVDPGDAAPVREVLARDSLSLVAILLTHHHGDHTGGVAALLAAHPVPVFGPAGEAIAGVTAPQREGDTVCLAELGLRFRVIDVPGHTRGHVAYFGHGALFCGDTLFGGGCGRLFEGSAAQMWNSLQKLGALPGDTRVYCAHEYTQSNLRFALAVEPGNAALRERAARVARLRATGQATVPSTIAEEQATNPFLRVAEAEVAASAARHSAARPSDDAEVFAALREWKNTFG